MDNRDTEAILEYHESTKHSQASLRAGRHFLDWENQPLPFKIYRDLEPIPLPKDFSAREVPALAAIALGAGPPDPGAGERFPDLATLSRVLYLSAGVTKQRRYPGGETYFRAYPNTGALEPRVVLGWTDGPVERLLGLDPKREGALTLVPLGRSNRPPPAAAEMPPLQLETEPLSRSEVDYPKIGAAHSASSLKGGAEAEAWRDAAPPCEVPEAAGALAPLRPAADAELSGDSLDRVIRRRGSTRAFDGERPLSFEMLSTALDRATRGVPVGWASARSFPPMPRSTSTAWQTCPAPSSASATAATAPRSWKAPSSEAACTWPPTPSDSARRVSPSSTTR